MEASSGGWTKKSDERLRNELKRAHNRESCNASGYAADLVDGDLYHWHVKVFNFFHASRIASDLAVIKEKYSIDHILVDFQFTGEYPLKPPSVRIIWPRFVHPAASRYISIGGTVHLDLFSLEEWSPIQTISSIVLNMKTKLVECEAGLYVDNLVPYSDEEALSALDSFYRSYSCQSPAFSSRPELNFGGKVLLPHSALEELVHKDSANRFLSSENPLTFELTNPANGRKTYCGVMEFMAPENFIFVPFWVMENLLLQEMDSLHVRAVSLPKGTFVKFKPHDMAFFKNYPNPKPIFESVLRNFGALHRGDVIGLTFDDTPYHFEVVETQPLEAIDINNVDIEVEFQRTLYGDEAVVEHGKEEIQTKEKVADKEKESGYRLSEVVEDDLQSTRCTNCNKLVPSVAISMHMAFCQRHNYCCFKCGRAVKITEKKAHENEYHALTSCPDCSTPIEVDSLANHLMVECAIRSVECPYCGIQKKALEMESHLDYCGTRTELCTECSRCIMLKDFEQHQSSACNYPVPKPIPQTPQPSPGPVQSLFQLPLPASSIWNLFSWNK